MMLDDDNGDDACDGDDASNVGCHHYCRFIPICWQVRISLERGTVPELSDPCDKCHHQYVSDCYVSDHGSMTVCFR